MEEFKNSNSNPTNDVITLKPRREIIIEDLQREFDKQLDKIAIINDFMALHGQRDEITTDLTDMKNKTVELKTVLADVRDKIQIFKTNQVPQYNELMDNMRKQHLEMLRMLESLEDTDDDTDVPNGAIDVPKEGLLSIVNGHSTNASSSIETPIPTSRQTFVIGPKLNTITPKHHQSPYVLRADPRGLTKLNKQFDIQIQPNDFDKIPKYIRGRDSIDELSTFLETVITKCFLDKYTLLHRDRENVQPALMQRWKMYRTQMEYFPGEMFITEGDISTLIGRMMDKKMNNRIAMLRHLHIIQDIRHGAATCYIWKGKK